MDRDRKDSEDSEDSLSKYIMDSSSDKDDMDNTDKDDSDGSLSNFVLKNVTTREGMEEMVIVDRKPRKSVNFSVNGQSYTVGKETPPYLRLSHYLRETLHLTGTKVSCGEGGCGACVVTATIIDPVSQTYKHKAVNSCLVPVLSCDGWEITTVEHLGGKRKGYHPLQTRLAKFSGSQCGFCSPGMVMSMNSLLEEKEYPNMENIEAAFDGNICRCTGYRPILDAMKTFAVDASPSPTECCKDIEDLSSKGNMCYSKWKSCRISCKQNDRMVKVETDDYKWLSPPTLDRLMQILRQVSPNVKYRLVAGNTSSGIYKEDTEGVTVFIDISKIAELKLVTLSPFRMGGGTSLAHCIAQLRIAAESRPDRYWYAVQMADHLSAVANTSVRNIGTLAGNLMIKHQHREFPSDLFILLEAVGAKIFVRSTNGDTDEYSPVDFLNIDMHKKIILHISFPPITTEFRFKSYKITPRTIHAHAYVNAAFLAKIEPENKYMVSAIPTLAYGGISSDFVLAQNTMNLLNGKELSDPQTISKAMNMLQQEVVPGSTPWDSSEEYRIGLTQALLYKFILSILGDTVPANLRSGADKIIRPLSKGIQDYQTDRSLYPVNKPVEKLEASVQCSGEAEYIDDLPPVPGELHAAFVLSQQANCEIDEVDATEALSMPGVVAFVNHEDIPGMNNAATTKRWGQEVFVTDKVDCSGQAIGLIIAKSSIQAHKAARKVHITYKNIQKPILTIREALDDVIIDRVREMKDDAVEEGNIEEEFSSSITSVSGEFEVGSQYHFHMETQTCLVRPVEDGLDIYSSTQWIDKVQAAVASALGIKENSINMKVRRLGGAYGGKISNPNMVAAACAVASVKLNKPVRIVMDLRSNMEMMGKRLPYLAKYKVAVNDQGKLQAVGARVYCDTGYNYNESTADTAVGYAKNCYVAKAWKLLPMAVLTNTPSNTYCRAPGSTQGHAIIENIMENVAEELGLDPLEFRLNNMVGDDDTHPLREIIKRVKESSDYENRKTLVETFNKDNLWKKKGISLIPIKYRHNYFGTQYNVQIAVYHDDGSVAVTHGGIEMGQGLNTKVCQVVARELGIPMDMISIKPTDNMTNPNGSVTGGSMGSECNCAAALIACDKLKQQMKPIKDEMKNPDWVSLVKKCFMAGVDLTARHMGHSSRDNLISYDIWAAVVTEVELDVLTGSTMTHRMDLLEDTGMAISPEVDVGQVEGGLVMGIGLWTSELVRHHPDTGALLDNNTWYYKVPSHWDIPVDMRIGFYDSGNNPYGVLGSKATGEPSILAGCSVLFALRQAVKAARKDGGMQGWFTLDGPATVENIKKAIDLNPNRFIIK